MIKFKNKNTRKIAILLLSGTIILSTSGCNENSVTYDENNKDYTSYSEIVSSKVSEESKIVSSIVSETARLEENSKEISSLIDSEVESIDESSNYSKTIEENSDDKDNYDVIGVLDNIDSKISNNLYKLSDEILEDYDILYDFIFEDGTIKGYTFTEVKDDVKAHAMSVYLKIDEKIDKNFPNTKKKIKDIYGNTKDKVKNKLHDFKEKIENKIIEEVGEEEYNDYIDKKDEFVSAFKEQTTSDIEELKEFGKGLLKKIRDK